MHCIFEHLHRWIGTWLKIMYKYMMTPAFMSITILKFQQKRDGNTNYIIESFRRRGKYLSYSVLFGSNCSCQQGIFRTVERLKEWQRLLQVSIWDLAWNDDPVKTLVRARRYNIETWIFYRVVTETFLTWWKASFVPTTKSSDILLMVINLSFHSTCVTRPAFIFQSNSSQNNGLRYWI